MRIIQLLLVSLTCAAALATSAQAQYPERAIKLVVPQAPGSATDNGARILAQELSKELGQSIIIENRPGGAFVIGNDAVAKALPDEAAAEGRHRDGAARACLQSHARDEHRRREAAPGGDPGLSCGLSWRFQVTQNDLWELQECLQTPQSQKKPIRRLRVLASQSEVALDRSETFLRNQDPKPARAGSKYALR